MENLPRETVSKEAVAATVRPANASGGESPRYWQLWSAGILALAVAGMAMAAYGLLRAPSDVWSAQQIGQLLPPMLFGLVGLLILLAYFAAQKDAIIRALREELIQQRIEAELNRELALLDPITEVYNRRYLRAILTKEISRVKRYGEKLAVMVLDITGFRRVNESLGHAGGDVVLRQLAHLVQTRIRNSDSIVRYGGDEFLLVLPDTDDPGLATLAARIKEAIRDWSGRSGMTEFQLRFAIGTASYSSDRRIDEVLELAEQRMLNDRGAPDPPVPAPSDASGTPAPERRRS
jgi:diguanylate cyclase (GGDEF)-like protein